MRAGKPILKIGDLELGKKPVVAGVVTGTSDLKEELIRGVEILEFRIDMFESIEISFIKGMLSKAKAFGIPVIATFRSSSEGGMRNVDDALRAEVLSGILSDIDAVDLEIASEGLINRFRPLLKREGKPLIGSYHNFQETPEDSILEDIFLRAKKMDADIVKIALTGRTAEDLLRIMEWMIRHREEPIITILMGELGLISRFLFPLFGSLLTYGSLTRSSAPGQIEARTILRFFELMESPFIQRKLTPFQ